MTEMEVNLKQSLIYSSSKQRLIRDDQEQSLFFLSALRASFEKLRFPTSPDDRFPHRRLLPALGIIFQQTRKKRSHDTLFDHVLVCDQGGRV